MQLVKLYGCRHSGTKYLTQLLEKNFECTIVLKKFSHKHTMPKGIPPDFKVIAIIKNPYSYIVNARKRGWSKNNSVKQLINSYVATNNAWKKLTDKQGIMIRYEDLLFDFNNTMEKVREALDLEMKEKNFTNIVEICGQPNWKLNNSELKFNMDYYKNEEYLLDLSRTDLDIINSIAKSIIQQFGYGVK